MILCTNAKKDVAHIVELRFLGTEIQMYNEMSVFINMFNRNYFELCIFSMVIFVTILHIRI